MRVVALAISALLLPEAGRGVDKAPHVRRRTLQIPWRIRQLMAASPLGLELEHLEFKTATKFRVPVTTMF